MALTDLIPWNRNQNVPAARQADPFVAFRREMDRMFDNFFRDFDVHSGLVWWQVAACRGQRDG